MAVPLVRKFYASNDVESVTMRNLVAHLESELSRAVEKTRRRRVEVQKQLDDANLELKMVLRALKGGHLVQV